MAKHSEIDLDPQAGARSSKMDQKTIANDGQKDVLQFLLKLAQFTEPLGKILPVLFSVALIPGFLAIFIYGITLRCLLIQDLPSASCVALTAFVCATLLATLVIVPILLPAFAVARNSNIPSSRVALICSFTISGVFGLVCGLFLAAYPLLNVPWFLLCIFILCFIGHACVMYPAKGISRLRHYFLLFISSIGSFFALCCLFITLALSLKDNLVVPLAMFTAILCELAFVFCIAKYKVTWIQAFFLLIGLLSVVSVFISISPVTNRFILSSIGFRSPGPVSILMEANAAGAFKDIPDVTAEARGEYLLIKNVGIAFRSGSLTIVEAPYAKSGAPAKGNQLIHIKSDDVKAIAQNAQVTGQ